MWRRFKVSKALICTEQCSADSQAFRGLASQIGLFTKNDRPRIWHDCKDAKPFANQGLTRLPLLSSVKKVKPTFHCILRGKHGKSGRDDISHLFVPVPVKARSDEINIGEEMTGPLHKRDVMKVLNKFYKNADVRELAREHGLDNYLYQQTFISFRKFCQDSESLPTDLHILINDILQEAAHIHDLYPEFRKHALKTFPHLNCIDDLYKISDLSFPPNWYPEARAMNRKIIFHAGPTNSGKTYHAMKQFLCADAGIYCGPLKLLASEVFNKSNEKGTPCDLVTGEERRFGHTDGSASHHVACTVEMANVYTKYDVAVIDEIQMLRDPQRGWAWTRALLGICAEEIHVCGEACAIDVVSELAMAIGEEIEVRRYKRLTPLTVENSALQSLDNIHPGDCVVCFSKLDIHVVSREIERRGHEVAVIYGGLPPSTKLAQAYKFNDPNHPCKVLVATDAIGMGLNLSIRRIIFYSLIRPTINEKGEKEMDVLSVSSALQIAGRAGRYGTQFDKGYVTTMNAEDLPTLVRLLDSIPTDIEQAGLNPTADQIELFAYHLPSYTLSNLMDIFVNLCTVDSSLYFMCPMDDFKFLADLIQHVPLQLRSRYVFCCSPIDRKSPFICAMFLKFVRRYSLNEPVTYDWLSHQMNFEFSVPKTISELARLEQVFDVFDIYLWLSYRFPDLFPEPDLIRKIQRKLDVLIEEGVSNLTTLAQGTNVSKLDNIEDSFLIKKRKEKNEENRMKPQTIIKRDGFGKGRLQHGKLTDRLVAQGLLSAKMLAQLQSEWKEMSANDNDMPPSPSRPKSKKGTKKKT